MEIESIQSPFIERPVAAEPGPLAALGGYRNGEGGMVDPNNEEEQGFKVQDKRRFTTDGAPREESAETADTAGSPEEPEPETAESQESTDAHHVGSADEQAGYSAANLPIDFSTFCISLGTSAMVNLGAVTNPETNETSINLPLAKQSIDILGILKDKTVGNLTPEEGRLLDNLLFDLRMAFVEASKKQS